MGCHWVYHSLHPSKEDWQQLLPSLSMKFLRKSETSRSWSMLDFLAKRSALFLKLAIDKQALIYNLIAATLAIVGTIIGLLVGSALEDSHKWILSFVAG